LPPKSKPYAGLHAIAFDGYGTIFNITEPDFITAMAEVCEQQGLQADAADMWRRFLKASLSFRSENHHEPVYRRYDEAWALQFDRVFRQLGLKGDAWAASMHLKSRLAAAAAFEEAHVVLDALRPYYRLALLSNADDDFLHEALARNRLEFEVIVTSEQAGAIKPQPEIFAHLSKVMGVAAGRILYAGDNAIPDVLGPIRAGMKAAWINRAGARRPRRVPPPHLRLRSLSELLPHLLPGQAG
jgi:putative hydrolase of the HAD superfamily